ncbi:hydantoinase B/oxoprolinase family protein [Microbispora triticiradicis]|uniref:Hydantoinase B/oxoprolinase family protein n=3 Tax=Microbispora TaxID=2005 RepID=A0ABY3LZE3_9ACTN|nr:MULTISPECIES: hydantoinase B/oxoprolinase family protein [Microbispora]RGA05187.1 hydantoinase B/oxoprolinase family protein [Microbispora triticiradicis]TLP53502.1 hydantoinase B/oxoprolinase family protein [Microbispora fusca]TYB61150.1 hydantoinase B/oxoprolinase family protein [Microbispora tritici]GLW26686.1 5-oxoprolinase [Microbispora amethystogenes]
MTVVRTRYAEVHPGLGDGADPVTTEIIRQGLNAAADQMKQSLIRTAFSPIIYEALDFAVAFYDADMCMLAQAPTLPAFMGTLGFCVREAVEGVGGPAALSPGDVILYNDPYGTGSHPQDAAMVVPIFHEDVLAGYSVIKAHWLDIGGKDPYCTDTIDVHQEGTIFPGVKLYDAGRLVSDVYRMILANSRMPEMVIGDINAMVAGARTGAEALGALVRRHGLGTFRRCVARMYAHGEALVRGWFERLPDGVYQASSVIDSDGVTGRPIPFGVEVVVDGSSVTVDLTGCPDQVGGPVNCPLPSTVAAVRIAVSFLAGAGEQPNEGHFRPLELLTRPGSLFHPLRPAPCFMYGIPSDHAIELIIRALAGAVPGSVPAASGGDINALVWWGNREATGEPWADGAPHPVGQGASRSADGASALMYISESATRFTPAEVWEARNPWRIERLALAEDSGGPGRHRGGLGLDLSFRVLEDQYLTSGLARTALAPWGLEGGLPGRPNRLTVEYPDGRAEEFSLKTRIFLPRGAVVHLRTGSGGGYGPPEERDPEAVRADLREGYITPGHARRHYPHAVGEPGITGPAVRRSPR